MRIKCISSRPHKYPLISSALVPDKFEQYLLPNTERLHHRTKHYEYLEQVYHSRDCVMAFLDFDVHRACYMQPVADGPMMVLLYMFMGTVRGDLVGYGKAPLRQGHSYLLYLPAKALHKAYLKKGHLRVMYCSFSQSYVDTMAAEDRGIADLLQLFTTGSPDSLLEKPARISFNALYQVWQVKTCTKSEAYRQSLLKARGVDLVLDYVSGAHEHHKPTKKFITEVLEPSEKIFGAKEIIDKAEQKLKIADIAKLIGITERQLKKGFKSTFNISIGAYQMEVLISNVRNLLLSTNASVKEISFDIGYADLSSLSRQFKIVTGVSPTKYRANAVEPDKLSK